MYMNERESKEAAELERLEELKEQLWDAAAAIFKAAEPSPVNVPVETGTHTADHSPQKLEPSHFHRHPNDSYSPCDCGEADHSRRAEMPPPFLADFARDFVEKNWVELWRKVNRGGLIQHQSEMAHLLEVFVMDWQRAAPRCAHRSISGFENCSRCDDCGEMFLQRPLPSKQNAQASPEPRPAPPPLCPVCTHDPERSCLHSCHGPLPKMFSDLTMEIEKAGCSIQLTRCVNLLHELRDATMKALRTASVQQSATPSSPPLP